MRKLWELLAVIGMVGADQGLKIWAEKVLSQKEYIPIIENVFHLIYTENTGAAFSLFDGQKWFLIVIVSVIMIVMGYVLIRDKVKDGLLRAGLIMAAGGGIGNLIDRIFRGFVVDYLYFKPINFPVFNLADVFITVGAGLMLLYIIRDTVKEIKAKRTGQGG